MQGIRGLLRPVWAEVDLDSLSHNLKAVKALLEPGTEFAAVVKADAYGLGAVKVAQVALNNGASRLAVATLDEAITLRRAGFAVPILVLGYTPASASRVVVRYGLTQTVYSIETAAALSEAATELRRRVKVHIKVDTGMGRIGVMPDERGLIVVNEISRLPHIVTEGIYTHFAAADEGSADAREFTRNQLKTFTDFVSRLEEQGIRIPIHHAANSAATLTLSESHLDMVRVGIALYGEYPSGWSELNKVKLRSVASLHCRIGHIKEVPAGTPISYGRTYVTKRPARIATLPLGYADGYSRLLSLKGQVAVKGMRAPVVGRVCMDQFMVDVTGIQGVEVGDEVVVYGKKDNPAPTVSEVAELTGTISYEVLTSISRRVPRVYIRKGRPTGVYYPDYSRQE